MKYETLELNEEVRKSSWGEFIELSDGFVHYQLAGPPDGDVVILIHGFSSPMSPVWDNNFEALTQSFRVLRYDLFGRGLSDRPKTAYNIELFNRQLYELGSQLELHGKMLNLVGLSMGGIISVVFANRHTDLVKKVSLIDPAGFPGEKPLFPLILRIPILNKIFLLVLGHNRIIQGQKEDFCDYDRNLVEDYLKKYSEQTQYKGFLRAIKSTIENIHFEGFREAYEILGKVGIPIQLIWGEDDQTIPFSTSLKIKSVIPHLEFHPIKNAGHIPNYTHSEEINQLLISFLAK